MPTPPGIFGGRPVRAVSSIVLAALLSGCLPALAAPAGEPEVTDPTGDAMIYTAQDAENAALGSCSVGGPSTARVCANATQNAPAVPRAGGTQAPPALDIVSVSFADDGRAITVDLVVASLAKDFPLVGGDETVYYLVCWGVGEATCRDSLGLGVFRHSGVIQFDHFFARNDGNCAKVFGCYFRVDVDVIPGTPGTLRFHVPRNLVPADTTVLLKPYAQSSYWQTTATTANYEYGFRAQTTQDARASGTASAAAPSTADYTAQGRDFTLAPPERPFEIPRDNEPTVSDGADMPSKEADLDILNVTLVESEKTLTVATQVGRVDTTPTSDHHYYAELTSTTGDGIVAGFDAKSGARTTYSGSCVNGCVPHPSSPLPKPVDVKVEAGSPGWINLTVPRIDLGEPGRGDTLSLLYIGMLRDDAIRTARPGAADAQVNHVDINNGDFVWEVSPWFFGLGEPRLTAGDDPDAAVLLDREGDEQLPIDVSPITTNFGTFDVTSVKASAASPTLLRFQLGVSDLGNVQPPTGYDAVFYAVALSTSQGSFMVGYYDNGNDKRDFFCAPDTAVLKTPARDPVRVVWQRIDGALSIVRDRSAQSGAGSTPGSLIFFAPYECFNEKAGGDIAADTLAAGAFIIRQGQVTRVDDVSSDGPVTVKAARIVDTTPWYVKPFGITDFWNIAGVVTAIVVALAGAIAVQRGALRRYLAEIDRIQRDMSADGRAREAALVSVQSRLGKDLLRNRISESHFVIVERKLETSLGTTRTSALADAFGDLPHRLLVALQGLLADGVMDDEDRRLFRAQLDAEHHLSPDAREAIQSRVDAWVRRS